MAELAAPAQPVIGFERRKENAKGNYVLLKSLRYFDPTSYRALISLDP